MATTTRSLFHSLRCRLTTNGAVRSNFTRNAELLLFYKAYSADTAIGDSLVQESEEKDDLRSRIFRLRLPKRSTATVLNGLEKGIRLRSMNFERSPGNLGELGVTNTLSRLQSGWFSMKNLRSQMLIMHLA